MTVDIRGKSGSMVKTAHVHSNDPKKPVEVLTISLEVHSQTAGLAQEPKIPAQAAC